MPTTPLSERMIPARRMREGVASAPAVANEKSLAFIGSDSARDDRVGSDADAEALSITRLEGSRWRGGRAMEPRIGVRGCGRAGAKAVGGVNRRQHAGVVGRSRCAGGAE